MRPVVAEKGCALPRGAATKTHCPGAGARWCHQPPNPRACNQHLRVRWPQQLEGAHTGPPVTPSSPSACWLWPGAVAWEVGGGLCTGHQCCLSPKHLSRPLPTLSGSACPPQSPFFPNPVNTLYGEFLDTGWTERVLQPDPVIPLDLGSRCCRDTVPFASGFAKPSPAPGLCPACPPSVEPLSPGNRQD